MNLPRIAPLFALLLPAALGAAPVNVALNRPATVDSINGPGFTADRAVDGDSTSDWSRWVSAGTDWPHWIEIELDQTYVLSRLKFWTDKVGVGTFPVSAFALQSWNGTAWTDLYAEAASANTGAVDASFAPTLSGNRIRLQGTAGEDNIFRLFEVEVHGEPHPLTFTGLSPARASTVTDHAAALVVNFNAAINAVATGGIRIENLDTGVDLGGASATVSGNELRIAHPGLAESARYAVHVPAGAVALASAPATTNGPIYWSFETAPFKPQVASRTTDLPDPTDPVELRFDRAVTLVDAAGIRLERFDDAAPVAGTEPALAGDTLTISHASLAAEEFYLVVLEAGSVADARTGEPNDEMRLLVYTGSTVLFSTSFDTGLEGFMTGSLLGLAQSDSPNLNWRWTNEGVGPDYDRAYLVSRTNYTDDFVVSPQVNLRAGRSYVLEFRASIRRPLHVGVTPSASLDDVHEIALVSSGTEKSVRIVFTATDDGPAYLIFFSGDTDPWQWQLIDSVTLTESVAPRVRINAPAAGASFRESDSIPVQVEAYGVAGPLESIELFDNDVLRTTLPVDAPLSAYDWTYHGPGTRTLRATATDALGTVADDTVQVTITFNDGTLPSFLGYDFDTGTQGWTMNGDGTQAVLVPDPSGGPGQSLRLFGNSSSLLDVSSPGVFLLAGETYQLSFRHINSKPWAFIAATQPGYPADPTGAITIPEQPDVWGNRTLSFSVPQDGIYFLTVFQPAPNVGWPAIWLDDVRLIGDFNSGPIVDLLTPASPVTTIAGARVNLLASATDTDGTITEVSFRTATGERVAPDATVTAPPYAYAWTDVTEGEFDVFARAVDDRNAAVDSASRSIKVLPNNLSISTYLGGADTDENFTGAAYLGDGTLVLGGILDPALFAGVTPLYLNGATAGDRGVVARLSEDGTTVLSVTVVGAAVFDLATDGLGRIHVAAGADGAVVLNGAADAVLWAQSYAPDLAHRIDAAPGGTFAVLVSPTTDYRDSRIVSTSRNTVYDASFAPLGSFGGASAYTTDLAVDEDSQTVVLIGWRNITSMEDDTGTNPVDVPSIVGRAYDGTEKWRAYDWGKKDEGDRWLNLYTNNMADTRGARVIVHEGRAIAGIEFDGGNTPLRYDPFDLAIPANVVGGDSYHTMANTSTVPKTFVGIYSVTTGALEVGQWITNRLSNGNDNTIRIAHGNLLVDDAGRIHVVGSSAAGLPMTLDPLPGAFTGGGYHLVYSPDLSTREFMTRFSVKGDLAGVAISPNGHVASAGRIEDALFLQSPLQSSLGSAMDACFTVGQLDGYYQFQSGGHPRLYFDAQELAQIRTRLDREPYASMYAELLAQRDSFEAYRPYDPSNPRELFGRARGAAKIFALSGDQAYAQQARADLEAGFALIGDDWASADVKGLTLYAYAVDLATAYDLCAASDSWDAGFNYLVSKRLLEIARVIVEDGGTEQPGDLGSNWRANRGSSAGLALLATDHAFEDALDDSAHAMVLQYLNANQGSGAARGWNPEGFGYTSYPVGSFVGPYAVAAARADPARDLRTDDRLKWMTWTAFAGITTALDIYGSGGVKTDWSDDNAHALGEGIYGLAFYFADAALRPGIKHAYDRLMGTLSPNGPRWDGVRHGAFWSILFYPEEILPQDPTEIWDWHRASDDSGGIGLFSFRNAYQDSDDILVQFKAKLRNLTEAHDGPDGLGFRVIGLGDSFVIGGGREPAFGEQNQATVYPVSPNTDITTNRNTGTLVGTPLIRPDGGGHVIASMATSNVGTTAHKRWLVTDYDKAATGADAVIIVADTTSNGVYWQLPTFLNNTITTSGNTFTITGSDGATLKGTILHPGGTPSITVGTKPRGDGYGLTNGGTLATEDPVTNPRITDNRYLFIQHGGDGDFLVVMTLQKTGAHPAVSRTSGTVADAVVRVGNSSYALQSDTVLYGTGAATPVAYVAPAATVTFDADGKGTLGGAAVQSVAYGAAAIAPVVSPNSGYTFLGWDKPFTQVVKSMTVTALYDAAAASGFAAWIADGLYGLAPGDRDADDNPDGDPYVNLLEYAFVLNPSLPDGAGVVSVRHEGGNLVLSYRVRDGASDLLVTPKYAADLSGAWTEVPGGNISATGSGPNYTHYEASMPIGEDPLFLVLEVSAP